MLLCLHHNSHALQMQFDVQTHILHAERVRDRFAIRSRATNVDLAPCRFGRKPVLPCWAFPLVEIQVIHIDARLEQGFGIRYRRCTVWSHAERNHLRRIRRGRRRLSLLLRHKCSGGVLLKQQCLLLTEGCNLLRCRR